MQQQVGTSEVEVNPIVFAPSGTFANDYARVRSGGVALGHLLRSPGKLDLSVGSVSPFCSSSSTGSILSPTRKDTTRNIRGVVRKVSKVPLEYPGLCPHSPQLKSTGRRRVAWQQQESWSHMSPPSSPPILKKNVWQAERTDVQAFWPKVFADTKEGQSSTSLKRCQNLQGTLHGLRRCNTSPGQSRAPKDVALLDSPAAKDLKCLELEGAAGSKDILCVEEQGDNDAPLRQILTDTHDTAESLGIFEKQLRQMQTEAERYGGARHATSVISKRLVGVVHRKGQLCRSVEAHISSLEDLWQQREQLLAAFTQGALEKAPAELADIPGLIRKYTHRPGEPVDANKSDFEAFIRTFKLPSKHSGLQRLHELMHETSEWWADVCLQQALLGVTHQVLFRLFQVAVGTGADREHPKLLQATKIMNDRHAERILQEALKLQEQDKLMSESSADVSVGPASQKAQKIEDSVLHAISEGVSQSHPLLVRAQTIVKELREADGLRKREQGRKKRSMLSTT